MDKALPFPTNLYVKVAKTLVSALCWSIKTYWKASFKYPMYLEQKSDPKKGRSTINEINIYRDVMINSNDNQFKLTVE
jgi:hypothetical protein